MTDIRVVLVLVVCLAIDVRVDASAEVMKTMSINYSKALNQCKIEKNLPDSVDVEFNNFWKLEYKVTNRDMGCAVICLSEKLDLVTDDGSLHHGNAKEFAMKHGADETVAQTMVDTFHQCENSVTKQGDDCLEALDVINCFKDGMHKLDWAPDLEILVGEILAEL